MSLEATVGLSGHIPQEVINIFLSEAADLLGQWDEACFAMESGSDLREALQWISRTTQSLRRASRGVGLEEFAQALMSVDELLRIVLKTDSEEEKAVLECLVLTHSTLCRWLVGLRTDPQYVEDMIQLGEVIRKCKSDLLEANLLQSHAGAKSIHSDADLFASFAQLAANGNQPKLFADESDMPARASLDIGERRVNDLIELVRRISTQHGVLEHFNKDGQRDSQEFVSALRSSFELMKELQEASVGMNLVSVASLFDRLSNHAIELANSRGFAIQFEVEGSRSEIDRVLISPLWESLARILSSVVENNFESPDERVKSGKMPMGVIKLSAEVNSGLFSLVIEDDGRGQGEGDSSPRGQQIRSSLEAPRGILSGISAPLCVEAQIGKGTRFEISLPTTPRLMEVEVVKCGENLFALPSHVVPHIVEPGTFNTHILRGDKQLIEYQGKLFPFVTLPELIEKPVSQRRRVQASVALEKGHVFLVRCSRDVIAVGVDHVLSRQRIVVNPLAKYLSEVRGLLGTIIIGNGDPVLIVDLVGIAGAFLGTRRDREAA